MESESKSKASEMLRLMALKRRYDEKEINEDDISNSDKEKLIIMYDAETAMIEKEIARKRRIIEEAIRKRRESSS